MTWTPSVTGDIKGRVLAAEYLQARGDAWDRRTFDDGRMMDPVISEHGPEDDYVSIALWLAFMAGSDWERRHRGRRYNDEQNSP